MKIGGYEIDWRTLVGAGVALLVFMLLPWFGTAPEENPFTSPARKVTVNAWESFDVIDLVLALTAIAAIAVALLARRRGEAEPSARELAPVFVLAALSAVLIVYRMLDPIENTVLWYGSFLGLLAVVAIGAASLEGERYVEEQARARLPA